MMASHRPDDPPPPPPPEPVPATPPAPAGATATLTAVLIVFGVAVVVVLPALGFLYTLAQRSVLEGEGEAPRPVRPPGS